MRVPYMYILHSLRRAVPHMSPGAGGLAIEKVAAYRLRRITVHKCAMI